jgi:hypothetical protein
MKYSVKYKKVFDKEYHIVDISSVTPENKMSEYYSIGTHTPMTAALGEKNQHYFRAKRGYVLNPETELHQYVKTILKHRFDTEEKFPIRYYRKDICPFEGKCIFYDKLNCGCGMLEKRLFEYDLKQFYDTAAIEKSHEDYTADVLLSSTQAKRRPVFLEVAVTHPCEPEKIASGIKIIELFVEKEDDAYCELEESSQYGYYNEKVFIKFHNFETKNVLKECLHYVGEKKYSPQPPIVIETKIPTKFYCYPQLGLASPLKAYYDNVEIGMLFASNTFAKPFVFDKAMSIDEKNFVVMGKDIYGAVKPWVVYVVSWNGRNYYHKVLSHFDYQSALKDFTLAQGKEWHGGDTLSDEC